MQINGIEVFEIYDNPFPSEYENIVGVGFVLSWYETNDEDGLAFGELVVRIYKDGTAKIDTESMGKDRFLKLMELLYDKAEVK